MPDNRKHILDRQVRKSGLWDFPELKVLSANPLPYLVFVLIILTFYPVFFNDFQYEWDDQWQVLGYEMVLEPTWSNIFYYFTHYVDGNYFPLNQLYYVLIRQLFGFDPVAFHAGSVLIHIVNTFLVYFLLRKWLIYFPGWKNRTGTRLMWVIATVFAVHPLQVEPVAWISASKVLLYTFFTLIGLIAYIRFLERGSWTELIGTFVCYLLSLMCKEQAVIMPLNLVLFFVFYRQLSKRSLLNYKSWLHLWPFFMTAFLFWYWSSLHGIGNLENEDTYPLVQRLVFGCYSLLIYIIRFLVPVKVFYFYGYPIVPGESLPLFYYVYMLMAIFLIRYLFQLAIGKKWMPLFGLLFFTINLLLVLHIVPVPRQMITADRYMYLSIVGIGIWGVYGLGSIREKWPSSRIMLSGCVAAYFVFCMVMSNMQSRKWVDSDSIKQEVRQFLEEKEAPGKDEKR